MLDNLQKSPEAVFTCNCWSSICVQGGRPVEVICDITTWMKFTRKFDGETWSLQGIKQNISSYRFWICQQGNRRRFHFKDVNVITWLILCKSFTLYASLDCVQFGWLRWELLPLIKGNVMCEWCWTDICIRCAAAVDQLMWLKIILIKETLH